jgi:putative alpha-1,2-mannosidase
MRLVKMSPDNQGNVRNGGYEYTIGSISGFRFLHSFGLSSMSVMPLIGPIETEPGHAKLFPGPSDGPFGGMWTAGYRSRMRKDTETGKPGYYAVDPVDAKTRVELTATLNGVPLKEPRLKHSELSHGGKLVLEMGPKPSSLWQ